MNKKTLSLVFGGIGLVTFGVFLGTRLSSPSPLTLAQRQAADPDQHEVHRALNTMAKRIAERSPQRDKTTVERAEIATFDAAERVKSFQPTIGDVSAFYPSPSIREQTGAARKTVSAALAKRYGKAVAERFATLSLNHQDVLQERTENPMNNRFATDQQKMEALPQKDAGALTNGASAE